MPSRKTANRLRNFSRQYRHSDGVRDEWWEADEVCEVGCIVFVEGGDAAGDYDATEAVFNLVSLNECSHCLESSKTVIARNLAKKRDSRCSSYAKIAVIDSGNIRSSTVIAKTKRPSLTSISTTKRQTRLIQRELHIEKLA